MKRKFESSTMLWNDGELPQCSFCDATIDEVDSLHETCFSGELVCDSDECRENFLGQVLTEDVNETT
jgi:hypothetical protein